MRGVERNLLNRRRLLLAADQSRHHHDARMTSARELNTVSRAFVLIFLGGAGRRRP
jgi:hypothetical protein